MLWKNPSSNPNSLMRLWKNPSSNPNSLMRSTENYFNFIYQSLSYLPIEHLHCTSASKLEFSNIIGKNGLFWLAWSPVCVQCLVLFWFYWVSLMIGSSSVHFHQWAMLLYFAKRLILRRICQLVVALLVPNNILVLEHDSGSCMGFLFYHGCALTSW